MKLIKRKKKSKNEFDDIQYMTGGNLYPNKVKLETQKDIDLSNTINDTLSDLHQSFLNQYTLEDYYMLLLHSNYFCNTIAYHCNDYKFHKLLIDVVRKAWINGRAGIYFNKKVNKAYVIDISNIEYNHYGEVVKIKYWVSPLTDMKKPDELENEMMFEVEGDECKNIAIFKWGAYAISAFIIYFPFVKYQNLMMKMMIAQTFAFNRKYIYRAKKLKNLITEELKLWYNPLNCFITSLDDDFINRFKKIENSTDGAIDFISYYKEVIGAYYAMYGRRMNLDFKRERNTVEEVSLTSGAIENIEKDWLNQFIIFTNEINEINDRLKIVSNLEISNVSLTSVVKEQRENAIFDNAIINDDNGGKNDV